MAQAAMTAIDQCAQVNTGIFKECAEHSEHVSYFHRIFSEFWKLSKNQR